MDDCKFIIRQRVDLACQQGIMIYAQALQYGDAGAHEWQVDVTERGNAVDLRGCAVRAYCHRADGSTAGPIEGTARYGRAEITLTGSCYAVVGSTTMILRAEAADGEKTTLAVLSCRVARDTTDAIVDPGRVIPDLARLLEQVERTEAAADRAELWAGKAEAAAGRADNASDALEYVMGETLTAAARAERAAIDTEKATEAANEAVEQITEEIVPQLAIDGVDTLPPGSAATATLSGDAKHPKLRFGIPRGLDGSGSVVKVAGVSPGADGNVPLTVNTKTPDTGGNFTLGAADVGAVPTERKVNGKTLSADIQLGAADVGALPADTPMLREVALYRVTLTGGLSAWSGNQQTVACEGISADDTAVAYLDTSRLTAAQMPRVAEAYSHVWAIELLDGQARGQCYSGTPNADIPLVLEVIR